MDSNEQKQSGPSNISKTRQRWNGAPCFYEGCESPIKARGFCGVHYARLSKNGDPALVKRVSQYFGNCKAVFPDGVQCIIPAYAKEFCKRHYQQFSRHGDPMADKSKRLHSSNYISIFVPHHPNANKAGRILEHRFVMSEHLGRPLYKDENVHHKNGNRHDNRLENLELWSTAQPSGQRVEDKLEYAIMILRRYAFEDSST